MRGQKSYGIRLPESNEFYRFMTTLEAWSPDSGLPLFQSDTPVSLSRDEAERFAEFNDWIGNDPVEIVEVEGPPTHRFADDPHPLGTFFPQLERISYRCQYTQELFPEKSEAA